MEGGVSVDWSMPWFAPWRSAGERAQKRIAGGEAVPAALNDVAAQAREPGPVHFVDASVLPPGTPYEQYIFETGACPTRDHVHDFFNGLAWLVLPKAKARLNALQAAQIAERGRGGPRGPVRDAITVFDENGAVLEAPPALWQALRERAWQRLFVELRPLWSDAHLLVFGHALLEKLLQPRKDITAHVWRTPVPPGTSRLPNRLDAWLAMQFDAPMLASKPFTPLPVLGVPGWWAANENFSFYDDSLVFRPARRVGA